MSHKTGFRFKQAELGVFSTKDSDVVVKDMKAGSRIIGLTRGQFSLIDLIHSVLKKIGPSHVICATWSAGIKDAHQVKWMVDTNLIQSFQIVTDHSYVTRQKKYALALEELFGAKNIRTSEIHAKFVLIQNGQHFICIRTSMNLNANKTCETFEIDNDKEIYDFYWNFIKHTFNDMDDGFTHESFKVNCSLDKFFSSNNNDLKSWSDL